MSFHSSEDLRMASTLLQQLLKIIIITLIDIFLLKESSPYLNMPHLQKKEKNTAFIKIPSNFHNIMFFYGQAFFPLTKGRLSMLAMFVKGLNSYT